MTQQGVLSEPGGSAARQVNRGAENKGRASGLGEMAEDLIEESKKADDELAG